MSTRITSNTIARTERNVRRQRKNKKASWKLALQMNGPD